jgi:site-specific DNA recombinase
MTLNEMINVKTVAYCRYSSDAQREASIRDQLRNIEAYCARMEWPTPTVYQDQAISGSRNDRKGYRNMLNAAKLAEFDVLLVDDLSRLSRDQIETAQVIRQLKHIGIRVIGVSDGLDTSRDGYKLEAGLRGLMSELYLDDLAKKTHRGLMGQAIEGYSAGGLPYGYKSTSDGKGYRKIINDDEARWVRFIFERYANGTSPRQIANELNRQNVPSPRGSSWSHSSIYPDSKGVGILGNQIYNGRQIWNRTEWVKDPNTGRRCRIMRPHSEWISTYSQELKIIEDELWQTCERRAQNAKRDTTVRKAEGKGSGGRGPKYLLSGLLKCGECGGSFVIQGRTHYGCGMHKNRGETVCTNSLKVNRINIEGVLLTGIKDALLSEGAYSAFEVEAKTMLFEVKPDSSLTKRQLTEAKKQVENIMLAIKAGILTASTKSALMEAEQKVVEVQEKLNEIERFEPAQFFKMTRKIYHNMVNTLENIEDVNAAREALRVLIGYVKLVPENGTLTAEIENAGLAGALQISMVAGAGFEPTTFGL